ncbi:MAG TPA: hypothetical protein VLJ80_02625 [Solirubrobacteraceae bacterium]|nr:hypothetical protein [Solirubrobacteraceae bacterium]
MTRLLNAWGALGRDQRLAAMTSLGLFVSMLLPWYSKTVVVRTRGGGAGSQSLSAFQAFSFVEAAVLLVSVGVLAMLFARAERRDFHLPGGDGTIVMLAGAWVAILIFYRLFDKPGLQGNEQVVSSVGVQWGIFVALLVALGLAYFGRLMRFGERGAPPLSRARRRDEASGPRSAREPEETVVVSSYEDEPDTHETVPERGTRRESDRASPARAPGVEVPTLPTTPSTPAGERRSRRDRPRYPPGPSEQMSFEDAPPED